MFCLTENSIFFSDSNVAGFSGSSQELPPINRGPRGSSRLNGSFGLRGPSAFRGLSASRRPSTARGPSASRGPSVLQEPHGHGTSLEEDSRSTQNFDTSRIRSQQQAAMFVAEESPSQNPTQNIGPMPSATGI